MKIAVYTICLNEKENAREWFASTLGADYVVVADSGSDDGGDLLLKDLGATVYPIAIIPWRFDDAHQSALALVPADADVCIPLHLDERLMPRWREALEMAWIPGTTKAFYTYQFSPELTFLQNRIHARKGYRWKYPDHEGIYPYGDTVECSVTIPELRIEQAQDRTKDRSMILTRLQWGMAEYPNDPRMLHYYAREKMYRGDYAEAAQLFEAYLRLPPTFPLERAMTAKYLAECWNNLSR